MPDIRTNHANAFETTLSSAVSGTDLVFNVQTTSGAPASPCYMVIDPDDPVKRQYVLFDGVFTSTAFVTTDLSNRHLAGSAASSGITHSPGAVVRHVTNSQKLIDLWDAVENRFRITDHTAHKSADDHTQYLNAARHTATDHRNINGGVPAGVILMWSGSVGSIPSGWALCDGTNGTPDLRGRFLVGAGGTYGVGAAGGADVVALTEAQIPSHTHTGPSHTHNNAGLTIAMRDEPWPGALSTSSVQSGTTNGNAVNRNNPLGGSTAAAGTGATGSTGSGASHENRPPFYALAYIMKL